jgi:FAD/FMN-containing dehydrogenase
VRGGGGGNFGIVTSLTFRTSPTTDRDVVTLAFPWEAAASPCWRRPQAAGSATTVIESLSGAVADVDSTATAFPWRRQAACVQWYTETPWPAQVDLAKQWLTTAHEAVQANSAGRYVNYVESDAPAREHIGGNLARLAAVRRRYDPNGLL